MMKKSLIIVLAVVMIMALCGCKKNEYTEIYEKDPTEFLEDDAVLYNSLDEINKEVGVNIVTPAIMGKSMETYSVVDGIAQYKCILAGLEFTIRASKSSDDISALLIDDKNVFADSSLDYVESDTVKAYRYFIDDAQYVISLVDNGTMDKETFMVICEEVKDESQNSNAEDASTLLPGTYMDSVSGRASADVLSDDNVNYNIVIEWANDASSSEKWTIDAVMDENSLVCNACVHESIQYGEDGSETILSSENIDLNTLEYSEGVLKCVLNVNGSENTLNFTKID